MSAIIVEKDGKKVKLRLVFRFFFRGLRFAVDQKYWDDVMLACGELTDAGNDKMARDFIPDPVEAYTAIDLVQYMLRTVEDKNPESLSH